MNLDSILDLRRDYPEAVSGAVWLVIGAFFLVRRMFRTKPLGEAAQNMKAALEQKHLWRWGTHADGAQKGKPTGNSIVADLGGQKLLHNFNNDTYSVDGLSLKGVLSKADRKALRASRDLVVRHLKAVDSGNKAAAEEARQDTARSALRNLVHANVRGLARA